MILRLCSFLNPEQHFRALKNGRMKTGAGNLLPIAKNEAGFLQQMAGDERAIENPGLASLHTVFLREHNRIAAGFKTLDRSLSDEELYQRARGEM
jgi:peroxidase